jgi:predicted regulator of Ras-like GTPase activity (Roadblock/LC7/MglB family)
MAAADPLTELLAVSEDVTAAVIFDRDGAIVSATIADDAAREVADVAASMLSYAGAIRTGASVERVEAVAPEGGVYVLREGDRAVVGVTGPDPSAALVRHDLRECLRRSAPVPQGDREAS